MQLRKLFLVAFVATAFGFSFAQEKISPDDKPIGFASVEAKEKFGGADGDAVTVNNKADFKKYASNSRPYIIYVDGMIDLSDGMLPKAAGGSSPKLDEFVKKNSSYENYESQKTAYAAECSASSDEKKSPSKYGRTQLNLSRTYGSIVTVSLASNKTIIGLGNNSGFKGGKIEIKGKNNIALRNLTLQDAYDPFPRHEVNDGFNAELDCVVIENSSNIWIDHCTLEDTIPVAKVKTKTVMEKWQTFDGLCDIKGESTKNITISNCILRNHDKTMLHGASDSDGSNKTRTVSHIQNYYFNCGQRLPLCRNTKLHVLNNYFDAKNSPYKQNYAIGNRKNALIYSEGNYFGTGISYSAKNKDGIFYSTGDIDKSQNRSEPPKAKTPPFNPKDFYSYKAMSAEEAKDFVLANSGAGKAEVIK